MDHLRDPVNRNNYRYRIRGVNSEGRGPLSAYVSGATTSGAFIRFTGAPVRFLASPSTVVTGRIELKWGIEGDASSYELDWREGNSGDWTTISVDSFYRGNTGFNDGRIEFLGPVPFIFYSFLGNAGTSYQFRLRSVRSTARSAYTAIISETAPTVVAPTEAPDTPTSRPYVGLNRHSTIGRYVIWDDIPGATRYEIGHRRTASGDFFSITGSVDDISNVRWTEVGVLVGRDNEFRVRGVNSVGNGPWSEITRYIR